jgi:hypothetical protein
LIIVIIGVGVLFARSGPGPESPAAAPPSLYPTLAELLAMSPADLGKADVALMNLRCAENLPGSEGLDVRATLHTLDEIAKQVDAQTTRSLYRYWSNPSEYEHSEPYFRLLVMSTVFGQDLSIRYNPKYMEETPESVSLHDSFGSDSRDLFIHGLTAPPRTGTCASMPVLYTAIGRRLGYPLKLVATKGHLFVRWEDSRTRVNVDATTQGFVTSPDDYYKSWPFKTTGQEIKEEHYLESMTPTRELATFLDDRACCLMKAGRSKDAFQTGCLAARLAPEVKRLQLMGQRAQRELADIQNKQLEQMSWMTDHPGEPMPEAFIIRPPKELRTP